MVRRPVCATMTSSGLKLLDAAREALQVARGEVTGARWHVPITLRSHESDVPPFEVPGVVPFEDCPLAVTHQIYFDRLKRHWFPWDPDDGYRITHRATGFNLGAEHKWFSIEDAMAVLMRCDPTFPGWQLAGTNEAAKAACQIKFKWAITE